MISEEKFDWCEYYKFADSFSSSDNPAELRSGISRFYYSAFCTCRDYIIEHRLWGDNEELKEIMTSKSSKVHEKTYEIFQNNHFLNKQRRGRKIARLLFELRDKRNDADYKSEKYNVKYNHAFVKARTKKLLKEFKKL